MGVGDVVGRDVDVDVGDNQTVCDVSDNQVDDVDDDYIFDDVGDS